MLKRLGIAVAALLIGGMVFAQESADLKASPANAGSVNVTWEWKGTPEGKIGESDTVFTKPYEIPATSGAGAKFEIIKGTAKFKTENGITAIYHGTKPGVTIDTLEKHKKAEYAITLTDAATIDLTVTGNGSAGAERMVAVKRGTEEVLLSVNNLGQDNDPKTITLTNAPAGTYRVILNGARIIKLNVHN